MTPEQGAMNLLFPQICFVKPAKEGSRRHWLSVYASNWGSPDGIDPSRGCRPLQHDMRGQRWDFEGQGKSLVYWRDGNTVHVSEGHHRINAALEIGREEGDWSFLEKLLQFGTLVRGLPPRKDRGRFPTRSWWSRLLERLGC
jgi:hypothetical protein